ncbi:MAG: outer rane immunogenic protein [Alphaproteobacteria bacterium]|jgi:outer membrane immunogenic protein|nr:outer rane immunogenic protein [Alphaproteobacteria bacterium]MEA3028294.1 outer rane immunogenic protein [Alphaproteobacteria bacterium]
MLHKVLLSSIAFIGLTGLASAADLYVKAAPQIRAQTWTGCYLGGHVGYGAEGSSDQYTFLQTYNLDATPMNSTYSNKGFAGGGQVGCQVQTGTFLWGVEGDFTSFKNNDSKQFSTRYFDGFTGNNYYSETNLSVGKDYLWSVRARLGILTSDVYHLYATMGIGGERGSYSYTDTHTAIEPDNDVTTARTSGRMRINSTGFVVGAGAEWKILPYLILRAEYLHYAIASNTALPLNDGSNAGYVTGPGLGDHVRLGDVDVVRVGASWFYNTDR